MVLREWQRELVSSVLDADPPPRLAGWMIGRGNGKSSLLAAWAIYTLMSCGNGGHIVVCARNQPQAKLLFNVAKMMVKASPELDDRIQVMRESMFLPRTQSTFEAMPSEAPSLEGLDYSLCIVDELQYTPRETVSTLMLAQGKRPPGESVLVGIGTPPADITDSVLVDWRNLHREFGDEYLVWREFSADEYQHHDRLCEHCIRLANPAYGDFLAPDVFAKDAKMTPEPAYRRSRLCQFVESNESPLLIPEVWDALSTGVSIKPGSDVVVSVDSSFGGQNADSTAIVIGTVSAKPHFDLWRVWASDGSEDFRVNVLEVEDAVRDACKEFRVREATFDPFRMNRSIQVLAGEGINATEFPWSPQRITKAVNELLTSAHNQNFTHSGNTTLRDHVLAAKAVETHYGITVDKTSRKKSAKKIDATAALIQCHSRCVWLGTKKTKPKRTFFI